MQYKQYILPIIPTSFGTGIEIRINYRSHQPVLDNVRGAWDSTDTYATNDVVADTNGKFWRSLQSNTNQTPAENAYWTAADNYDFVQSDQTQVLQLDPSVLLIADGGIGALENHISRVEGKLTPTTRSFQLYDYYSYKGVTGAGSAVSEDLTTTIYKSLLNKIFDDATSLVTIHMARVKDATAGVYNNSTTYHPGDVVTYNGDTWEPGSGVTVSITGTPPGSVTTGPVGVGEQEAFWVKARELYCTGDCKVNLNTSKDLAVANERTASALQKQAVKVTIDVGVSRAQNYTVRDLFAIISESDMVTGGPIPFYGGFVIRNGVTLTNGRHAKDIFSNKADIARLGINFHLHMMSWATVLSKIASRLNFSFDPNADCTTCGVGFMDKLTEDTNPSNPAIGNRCYAIPGNMYQKLGVVYEYLFGSDPRCELNVAQLSSPVTFDWNTPLSTVLEKIARLFFAYPRMEYDQAKKRPRLRMISQWELNTVAGTTTSGAVSTTSTTVAVGSAATLKGTRSYPFYAQFSDGSGRTEIVQVTSDNGTNVITFSRPQTAQSWVSGVTVAAVRDVPANWDLTTESSRDQQIVSAGHVEVNNSGDSDILACPHERGTSMPIEIGWRAKIRAHDKYFDLSDLTYNRNLDQTKQSSTWTLFTGTHVLGTDATISFIRHDGSTGFDYFSLNSPSHDFSNLNSLNGVVSNAVFGKNDVYGTNTIYAQTGNGDVFCFANGAFAVVESIVDHNTVHVVQFNAGPPNQIAIPTGSNIPYCVGYTFYVNDLVVTDNSQDISSATLDFKNFDVYGNLIVGQQIVIPKRGIFTIQNYGTLEAGAHHTDVHYAYVDRSIIGNGAGLNARVGGPDINGDGYLGASFLYYYDNNASTGNGQYFPSGYYTSAGSITGSYGANVVDWSGGYSVSRWQFNPDPGAYLLNPDGSSKNPPDNNFGNTLYSSAQIYAAQNIGNFVQLQRRYAGCLADDGTFNSYDTLDSLSEYINGADRNFFTIGYSLDEFTKGGSVRVNLLEWPNFSGPINAKTYPVWVMGGGGSSGGASSVGGSGGGSGGASSGGTVDLGTAVITKPGTPHRNKIQSTAPGTQALEIEALSGATDNLLTFYASDGTSVLADFDSNGDLTTSLVTTSTLTCGAATFSAPINMLSHNIINVTDPVNAQDAATKHYVDNQVNTDVALAPSTPTRNEIQPTTSGVVGLIIKSNDNVTDYFQLLDNTGALVAGWHGSTGQLYTPFLKLTGNTPHGVPYLDISTQVQTVVLTNGQLLVGRTGNDPLPATLTAGTGVSITNGAGTITISATGGSGTVTSVNVSGGTTGLMTSGGPITTSGTITLAGTLAVANGGTGQTSFTDGQILIGNTTGGTLTPGTITSTDASLTVTAGHGTLDLSTDTATHRTKVRTVKFYHAGSVMKTFTFIVQETWDSTNSAWIPQTGVALPFEAKTGSTYGWNTVMQFHKTGTEHGNVEIVGISATGVPDYWASGITQVKRDTGAIANQNVYYAPEHQIYSEDQGTWLIGRPLEKVNTARRIFVSGRILLTGTNPAVSATWVNISDPIFPLSVNECLIDSDKDGGSTSSPGLTWQPATPSLLIDFGTRLKPVGLHCSAAMSNSAGGITYMMGAMPCRNQVGTANQATIEFWKTNLAVVPPTYNPRSDPTAPPGGTEVIYVDIWGLLEIIGDDARTA